MDMSSTSVGNEANQARYYQEILSGFKAAGITVWMFAAIDEAWKAGQGEGAVGAHWGIFNTDRSPKQAAQEIITNLN
jgi:exo-beta-1,3-glucanase (GH17 family)